MTGDAELKRRSYDAVTGATRWITGLRRSADLEGFDPFSDGYTDYENGFVSVAEGLTTVLLTKLAEQENEADFGTAGYSDQLLSTDLEYLLQYLEEDQYPATPYLEADATEAFTDGVSFASTVLLLANELDDPPFATSRIDDEYLRTIDWFLDNTVEGDNGVGWAWCGSAEMDAHDDFYPPQTYFTFSSTIALVDALTDRRELLGDREAAVRSVLEEVKDFLLFDYRVDDGWIEFEPTSDLSPNGYDELDPNPSLLSTCYTIWAVCYIINSLDDYSLDDSEQEALQNGMGFILDLVEDNIQRVYAYNREYQCRRGGETYYEGTTPYTLLNTFLAYRQTFDMETDRIDGLVDELVTLILETCWGGTESDPEAGFRHFESQDVESERNVTVIYATEVAVESLLQYGVDPPEQTSVRTEIASELQQTQDRVLSLLDKQGPATVTGAGPDEASELETMNAGVISRYEDLVDQFGDNFQTLWIDEISDHLTNATMNSIQQVPDDPVDIHVEEFLKLLLDDCYFENDPDAFGDSISTFRTNYEGFIMEPYDELLAEFESLDDEEIADPVRRKKRIDDVLSTLRADLTNGHDPREIADAYNESLS